MPPNRRPVLATPLDRPVRDGEAVSIEDLLAGHYVPASEGLAPRALAADVLGDGRAEEGAHPRSELTIVIAQGNIHWRAQICLVRAATARPRPGAHAMLYRPSI